MIALFLIEIVNRDDKIIGPLDKKLVGFDKYVVFKEYFFDNIDFFINKFKGKTVFVFDKSFQEYTNKKFLLLKRYNFNIVIRDEEHLVRTCLGLQKDRFSYKNVLISDFIITWNNHHTKLIEDLGINSSKIMQLNFLRFKSTKLLEKNDFEKILLISSFGDLYPINGQVTSNSKYIKHLEESLENIVLFIKKYKEHKLSYRFHPFENNSIIKKILFNKLEKDIFDQINFIDPYEENLEKSLINHFHVVHIGSTVSYDHIYMFNGQMTYYLKPNNTSIYGPESVSVIIDVDTFNNFLSINEDAKPIIFNVEDDIKHNDFIKLLNSSITERKVMPISILSTFYYKIYLFFKNVYLFTFKRKVRKAIEIKRKSFKVKYNDNFKKI